MKAYPYDRVPKVSRAEVELRRRFARRALPVDGTRALEALAEVVGAELRAGTDALFVCDPGTLRAALVEPLVGVVLVPAGAAPGRLALLECDPALAGWVADRLLGGEGVADPSAPLADVHRGALGYAAARVADAAELPWRVGPVLTTEDAFVAALGDEGSAVWSVDLTVAAPRLGAAPRTLRLWVPRAFLDALPPAPATTTVRDLPLAMQLDAGEAELSTEVLRSLRGGDVLVPDELWWPGGRARLRARGATSGWWCQATDDGWVVQDDWRALEAPAAEGRRMETEEEDTRTDGAVAAVGDAPVTLGLELASFELTVAELAALKPGEVVATGVPIGEAVRLRAGSKVIAIGELVEVEGEVGVRLIELGS